MLLSTKCATALLGTASEKCPFAVPPESPAAKSRRQKAPTSWHLVCIRTVQPPTVEKLSYLCWLKKQVVMVKFKDISGALAQWAPPALAESYDNVGLLVGEPDTPATGVLINLDVTEALLDEAQAKGANLILTHHPIWFGPRKRLNGEDYVSRILLKAIRQGIGLLACHTNLDNVQDGVNRRIGERLGVQDMRILAPKSDLALHLGVHVPLAYHQPVLEAMLEVGAGKRGNYSHASFSTPGTGTFQALEGAQPFVGAIGQVEQQEEVLIQVILPSYLKGAVLSAMRRAHPYEMPSYHIFPQNGPWNEVGSGMIGILPTPLSKADFLAHVKKQFGCGGIRYADAPVETVQKVAWCGGAGSFLTQAARRAGADAFVTGDITYHKFFDNEGELLLLDIGHHESEQFTSDLLHEKLSEKFPTFAVHLSEINTNPVKYF